MRYYNNIESCHYSLRSRKVLYTSSATHIVVALKKAKPEFWINDYIDFLAPRHVNRPRNEASFNIFGDFQILEKKLLNDGEIRWVFFISYLFRLAFKPKHLVQEQR
jgi:hypothetical protein